MGRTIEHSQTVYFLEPKTEEYTSSGGDVCSGESLSDSGKGSSSRRTGGNGTDFNIRGRSNDLDGNKKIQTFMGSMQKLLWIKL